MFNAGADRCLPYQHDVVAPADSMILRARKDEALLFFVNTSNAHLRVRYMHMSPERMDAAGLLSGRRVTRGEDVGQVGNYNDFAGGTTYHLHFDLQVPTEVGWSLVNPYMTLVAAYEHLLGARGREIKPGDPVPASAAVPPVVGHPDYGEADPTALPRRRPAAANALVELPKSRPRVRAKARTHRHHRRKTRRLSRE
jgi:murein DD-endopeptidase MepM/ murein hydrolase activator NlpD